VKWLICWSTGASNDLDRLDPDVAERIVRALDRLAIEGAGDVRRLAAIDPPEYRLRVGKWRIRFQIDAAAETLYVLHVARRDEAY
jgi:mRNA-degrading endonuclease RelE of RelBE toxin-antitoxin system